MNGKSTALKHLPVIHFESLTGWSKLEEAEQAVVRNETQALAESLFEAGNARLAIGEHLSKIREVLGARHHRGMWERYLKTLNFSRATANRYIRNYEVARTILPKPVMQVAMMRGMDTINAKLVAVNPPPKTHNTEKIARYLERLQKPGLTLVETPTTEGELKKAFTAVRLSYHRVGNRAKPNFIRQLIGMEMTLGSLEPQTFRAEEIPAEFVVPRGRPTLKNVA